MDVDNRTPKHTRMTQEKILESPTYFFLMDYSLVTCDFWSPFRLSRLGILALCTRRWCCIMLSFRLKPSFPFLWQSGCGQSCKFLFANIGVIGVEWVAGQWSTQWCLCRLFFVLNVFPHILQVWDTPWTCEMAGDGCSGVLCPRGEGNALGITWRLLEVGARLQFRWLFLGPVDSNSKLGDH